MVVYRGLMENPNNRAMLGATDIRRQANAGALAPIVRGGQAARIPAQRPIVLPADDSLGKGLSQLGRSMMGISQMNKEKAARDAVSGLFQSEPSGSELDIGVEPSARIPSADQMLQVGLMHPGTQAGKQALMLGGQLAQRESTQGFQRQMLDLRQTFADEQRQKQEEFKKNFANDNYARDFFKYIFDRNTKLKIANIGKDARIEAANIAADAKTKNKSVGIMTYGEARGKFGLGDVTKGDKTYLDSDPVLVTRNFDGSLDKMKFLANRFKGTDKGVFDLQDLFNITQGDPKTPGVEKSSVLPKSVAEPPAPTRKEVKTNIRGATGLGIGKVRQVLDNLGTMVGLTDGDIKAAETELTSKNAKVTATVATISPILKKNGRDSNFTRLLTQLTEPTVGFFDTESSTKSRIGIRFNDIQDVIEDAEYVFETSDSKKDRGELRAFIRSMTRLQNFYGDMYEQLDSKTRPRDNDAIERAKRAVGIR